MREPVIINHSDSYVAYFVESFLLCFSAAHYRAPLTSHEQMMRTLILDTLYGLVLEGVVVRRARPGWFLASDSVTLPTILLFYSLFEDEATSSNAVAATIGGGGGGLAVAAIGLLRDDYIIHQRLFDSTSH